MTDNQTELLIQLVEKLQENGVAGLDFSASIVAFYSVDESEREQLVDDYINDELEAPKADSSDPAYENIVLAHDLLERLSAAGINYDNPLYAQHISDYWNADDKETFINNLDLDAEHTQTPDNDDEQVFGENEGGNPVDDAWKAGMREAFQKAADKHKQLYEETPDTNNPHNLKFNFYDSQANKDDKKADGFIIYHDRNHVSLKSQNYKHFLTAVEASKNAGITTITFGESIQTPEYKTNLYMACLTLGMEMRNPPSIEEIKGINPKLDQKLTMMEMRKEVIVAHKKVTGLQPQFDNNAECQALLKNVKDAKDAFNKDKDNQDLKDALAAAKAALNANPLNKNLNDAKTAEKASIKKAFDYVVSQKPDAKTALQQKMKDVSERDTRNPAPTKTLTQKTGESDADFQSRQTLYSAGKAKRDADKDVQARRRNTQYVLKSVVSGR